MKRILTTLSQKWPEYLIEAFVIIASILGAFALESWGQKREEQAKQKELLSNLLKDLKVALVQSEKHEKEEAFNSAMLKLSIADSKYMDSIISSSNASEFLQQTLWFSVTEVPSILSYNDLVSSGQTGLITNTELRKELNRLKELLEELRFNIDDKMTVQQIRIDKFIFDEIDAIPVITPTRIEDKNEKYDYATFLKKQPIRNALAGKLSITDESLDNRKKVTNQLKKVIDLIASQLGIMISEPDTGKNLPDALEAGWQGHSVCEVLEETNLIRVLRCSFPPGVGHERHYHPPHAGYTVKGGTMEITSAFGTDTAKAVKGTIFMSSGTDWHHVMNIGDETTEFLIIEPK
jgi:quercetin dioxygenase-like cupin family protein